jgi:hypothetical protein
MLFDEETLSFSEAARALPRVNGKRVSTVTVWRWAAKGIRGIKLETRRLGRRYVTSKAALDSFCKQLAELPREPKPASVTQPANARHLARREKEIEQSKDRLRRAGVLQS